MTASTLAVCGGGPVGSLMALGAARLGWHVHHIERAPRHNRAPLRDERTTALSPATRAVLQALDVWPALREAAEPIHEVHVSEQGGLGTARLSAQREGRDALGWVVHNADLEAVLDRSIRHTDSIERVEPAVVEGLTEYDGGVSLRLAERKQVLHVDALVVAEGAGSSTRALLGVETDVRDNGQAAVITTVELDRPHDGVAHERFTHDGALALLPCGPRSSALVWSVPEAHAKALAESTEADFIAALGEAFGHRLGRMLGTGARRVHPLRSHRARRMRTGRCLLIGNTAHTLHPIAGQGFNLGVRDVSDTLGALAEHGAPAPDAESAWRAWERERLRDLERTWTLTHGLLGVFSGRMALLRAVRGAALNLLEVAPAARRAFLARATGEEAQQKRLTRPSVVSTNTNHYH